MVCGGFSGEATRSLSRAAAAAKLDYAVSVSALWAKRQSRFFECANIGDAVGYLDIGANRLDLGALDQDNLIRQRLPALHIDEVSGANCRDQRRRRHGLLAGHIAGARAKPRARISILFTDVLWR